MLQAIAVVIAMAASVTDATAYDTYSLSTHELSVPAIQVGQNVYTNVVVSIGLSQVIYVGGGSPQSTVDSYIGGILTIPVLFLNGYVYTNI